jgi:hypothetical protein
VRIGAFLLFFLAISLLSLLDGIGATAVAFVLCAVGGGMIANRHLGELAAEAEDPDVRISVVRWNY